MSCSGVKVLPASLGTSGTPATSPWELFWDLNEHQPLTSPSCSWKDGTTLKKCRRGGSKPCDYRFGVECNKKENCREHHTSQCSSSQKSPFSTATKTTDFSPKPFCRKSLNIKAAKDICLHSVLLLSK